MKKKIELLFFIKKIKSYASYIVIVFITLLGTAFLGLLIPLINKAIMDKGILMKDYPYLKRMILLFLCIYFFKCLIEILNSYFIARLNAEYRLQLFNETYQHLLKLPMRYFEKNDITKIYNNMNADINAVSKISDGSLFNVFSQLIYFVGGIVCLFHINIQLAIVGLISIPLKYSITAFFSEKNKKLMQKYISINSQFANWFQDSIAGIRELKIYRLFKRKNSELQQIKSISAKYEKLFTVISSAKDQIDSLNTQIVIMLVYLIGASILIKGKITYGDILAFLTYLVYVTNPVTSFSNLKFIFASMNPSAKRLYELLHIPEEQDSQKLILDTENYILEFQNVNYTIEDRTILKDISFTLNSGDRVAIVGDNGSGKSTLVNLIARFIEPSSGMILLNGENIRELNIEQYREHICIADTKSHLFELPIIENIDICAENGSASIVDLDAAITLSEFDDNLIQAIKKNEGRNSNNLSAGEKQKIVIARSLWNKRAIMIFDEATCNIDLKSRKKIESVIAYQFCQSITIFIAHNADSLVHFNKIIFIKDNMIYRIGTYEEMIQDRYFQELFSKNEDNR